MVNSDSILEQHPGEGNLPTAVLPSDLGSGEEHVAHLVDLSGFGLLLRSADLLDVGVAAVLGMASGEAEILAVCFHVGKFTPAKAATWLAEWGFKPLRIIPNSARFAAAVFDAPLAAQVGRAD